MKILQIGRVPKEIGGNTTGGVARHVWDLSKHLVNSGHDVSIAADNVYFPDEYPISQEGLDIYGVKPLEVLKSSPIYVTDTAAMKDYNAHFGDFGLSRRFKYLIFNIYNRGVIKEVDPDLIHVHHLDYRFPSTHFERNRIHPEVPILTAVHGFHGMKFSEPELAQNIQSLIQRNLRNSRYLLLNSGTVEKEMFEFFDVPDQLDYWTGINGIDTDVFHPTETTSDSDCFDILYVSRLEERKGIFTLIDGLAKMDDTENLSCTVVGEGEEEQRAKSAVSRACLDDVVQFKGRVPSLTNYYNQADVLAVPSYHEDFGLVYLEAMACGTPAIGTTGVPKEVIPSEEVGFRIPPQNSSKLKETLETAREKVWREKTIIQHAQSFNWKHKVQFYNELYDEVVGATPSTS